MSRMLCEDPSCHLLAIILVNLTFADGDLRRELIKSDPSIQLVEALSFALLVRSFILFRFFSSYFGIGAAILHKDLVIFTDRFDLTPIIFARSPLLCRFAMAFSRPLLTPTIGL